MKNILIGAALVMILVGTANAETKKILAQCDSIVLYEDKDGDWISIPKFNPQEAHSAYDPEGFGFTNFQPTITVDAEFGESYTFVDGGKSGGTLGYDAGKKGMQWKKCKKFVFNKKAFPKK